MTPLSREEAVRWPADRPLKVVAGAGTGKTRFLVDRFIYLVKEAGVPPDRILGLTFTRKAAQELQDRLREHLGAGAGSAALHIRTFDSFWLRLLLEHPAESRLEEPVNILDDGLARILQWRIVREIEQGCPELSLTTFRQMNLVDLTRAVAAARRVVDAAKLRLLGSEQLSPVLQELRARAFPSDPNETLALETIRFIQAVARIEDRLLAESGALDHGHILLKAHGLLARDAAIRARVRNRFRHLLIDEAQDTNFGQFALLKFIAADRFSNVTAVGDTRQSIFGFRDADPQSLQDFEATICNLGKNFRSFQAILDLAVEVLRRSDPDGTHGLVADAGESTYPSVAGFVAASAREENEILCNFLHRAIEGGARPGDIAILARARATLVKLEDRLRGENIPTVSLVGGFYRRPEVLDARAYLAYLLDPNDRAALVRILERGPEPFSLAEICDAVGKSGDRFFTDPERKPSPTKRVRQLSKLREELQKEPLSPALRWFGFLEKAGYFTSATIDEEHERLRAQANLRKLFELASQLATPPISFSEREILSYLDFNIEAGEDEVEANYGGADGVVLTTIHRAKGLEFPIVIYCGVHDRVIQRPRDFFVHLRTHHASGDWHYAGTGLLLAEDFASGKKGPAPDEAYKKDAKAEEKRLDHVALTRAKSLQVVCGHRDPNRTLPQALQILEDFATHSPQRFFFSREPDAEQLAPLLPTLTREESPKPPTPERLGRMRVKRSAQMPILRWSFSDFEREYCRQQGITTNDAGTAASSPEEAMLRGTIVHEAIRLAGHNGDWPRILRAWNGSSHFPAETVSKWQERAERFLVPHAKVFSEYPFELLLEAEEFSLWLRGIVDRLEIQKRRGRLVDFKTGQWNEQTAARAERQLNFYAMAWRKGLWPEVKELTLCIVHLDVERIIDIPLNPNFEETLKGTATKALRSRENLTVA